MKVDADCRLESTLQLPEETAPQVKPNSSTHYLTATLSSDVRCLPRLLLAFGLALATLLAAEPTLAQSPAAEDAIVAQLRAIRADTDDTAGAQEPLRKLTLSIPEDAPYPLQRDLLRTQMVVMREELSFDDTLAMMKTLRDLAAANGDSDTVSLMDINRIYMSHSDDDIGKYIDQLNEVRAQISSDASAEVMEALELSYGNMYFDAGNFDTALRHQLAALDWAGKLEEGSTRAQLYRLGTIAELYNAMELPDMALDYVDRAFTLSEEPLPTQNRVSLLGARAMALMASGRLPEAEVALSSAEALNANDASPFNAMRIAVLRAELQLAMSAPEQAIVTINRIESLAKEQENSYYIAKSWMLRGDALMQLDRVDEGQALMQKAREFFESKGQMIDVLAGLNRQIGTLRGKQLYQRAVELMDREQQLWTRLFRNERGRAIAEVEARYSAQELEHQINTLSAENRVQQERLRAERLGSALATVLALFAVGLSVVLFRAIRRARRERDRFSDAVRFDSLTGAYSRYQFQRRMEAAASEAPVADAGVLLLDLDHFKSINDRHGHDAGDLVLRTVVDRIRRVLGDADEIYRWGGEEFLVIFNDSSDASVADAVRRILREVEDAPIVRDALSMTVSVSGGCVRHPLSADRDAPLTDAVRWADAALYLAKNAGRRRVERVEITERGRQELGNRPPADMTQLVEWQQSGYLQLTELTAQSNTDG